MPKTEKIKFREDFRDELGADTEIIDKRAIVTGLGIAACLLLVMLIWKLTPDPDSLRQQEEFEFKVAEPDVEKFELEEPIRDIIREKPEELPDEVELETPDIQISVNPTDVPVEQPIIQSQQVEIDTPDIDITANEMEIEDTPLEISETSEDITWALATIAADTSDAADIYKYNEPNPSEKPQRHMINRAPSPNRTLSVLPQAFGDQDVPTLGELGPVNINLFGTSDYMRTMQRAGGVKARASVDAALHWLAVHQEPEGHWDSKKHEGQSVDAAVTGFALLAFMGGGHTTRKGEYRRNVLKGLEALIRYQDDKGRISKDSLYTHGICAIALCEAYGRARDPRIGEAAQKAIRYNEWSVNTDGGWRYGPRSGVSDMSVAAWFIQSLKTAKLAQIKFDGNVYSQSLTYVDSVTDKGGGRNSAGGVGYVYNPGQSYGAGSPPLTAAGMMVRQFTGMGVKNHLLVKGAEITKRHPPKWKGKNFYHWYYATYAMHNMGGEYRIWWNQRIRNVLLRHQSRQGDNAGSWDPKGDTYGAHGGRVMTTALGALCLEVYYRYSEALNSFGSAPELDELFFEGL